ncbi:hypothetical protein NEDG_00964 [Nematocida displodere]|uniref:Homeobox domain-containing protein n=1 Tax=Nematocida displodere TaxID=1805483 RepID=A0A177EA83_9MICR|nr:hypothetical protein NEDG_00964 [Nematocida displodere]
MRDKNGELTVHQRDLLDAYFYRHNIKLTKKNLKVVSKTLGIPHRRIVEYVNHRQRDTHETVHEEYLSVMGVLNEIHLQIKEVWNRFESSYK